MFIYKIYKILIIFRKNYLLYIDENNCFILIYVFYCFIIFYKLNNIILIIYHITFNIKF